MTDPTGAGTDRSDRGLLVALAVCCAGPMLLIVVLTTVLGVAVGPAAAIAILPEDCSGVCEGCAHAELKEAANGQN